MNSLYPKMIVLETMYVMSNIICHFITCKLISCFVYSFLDLIINTVLGKKVTDVEIPYKSLNTFFLSIEVNSIVKKKFNTSWDGAKTLYANSLYLIFFRSSCIINKLSTSRFKFSRSRKIFNNKETQT